MIFINEKIWVKQSDEICFENFRNRRQEVEENTKGRINNKNEFRLQDLKLILFLINHGSSECVNAFKKEKERIMNLKTFSYFENDFDRSLESTYFLRYNNQNNS